jgi:hypothetical protein
MIFVLYNDVCEFCQGMLEDEHHRVTNLKQKREQGKPFSKVNNSTKIITLNLPKLVH